MEFPRLLDLEKYRSSLFLFGPRMTGKTVLLGKFGIRPYYDLLDPVQELKYKESPQIFWDEVRALPRGSRVVVDEIQRVPSLLDYVQMGIDRHNHQFFLSGSSARKLRRGGANLLGGRALDLRLHPLSLGELGADFDLSRALSYGTLPKVYLLGLDNLLEEACQVLRSYYTIYIQQEIQAEAITRQVPAFQRFLRVAAQSNAQIIEFANVGRHCQVEGSVVRDYFQILEDTLMGDFLWQWDASERKKSRGKFYFFDTGVVRALQNRLSDPPTGQELGLLFETWFVREMVRLRDYEKPHLELSFWRERDHEVDLLFSRGEKRPLALEIKSGLDQEISQPTLERFKAKFPDTKLVIVSRLAERPRRSKSGVEVLPWREAFRLVEAEL